MKRAENSTKRAIFIAIVAIAALLLGACSVPVFPASDSPPPPVENIPTITKKVILNNTNWVEILKEIENQPYLVTLDLSECEVDNNSKKFTQEAPLNLKTTDLGENPLFNWEQQFGTSSVPSKDWVVFNPNPDISTGKNKIAHLILPDKATLILDGDGATARLSTDPKDIKYGMRNITITTATFKHFTALRSVTGRNVKHIGRYAFARLPALERAEFPEVSHDLGPYELTTSFAITDNTTSPPTLVTDWKDISLAAFYECTALKEVIIPNAKIIGMAAFKGCTSLRSVKFDSVWMVYEHAFEGCTGLTQVDFPVLTKICNYAFYNCTSLTRVSFPGAQEPEGGLSINLPNPGCGNPGNGSAADKEKNDAYRYSVVIFDGAFYNCRALRTVEIRNAWNVKFGSYSFANIGETLDIYLRDGRHSLNDVLSFGRDDALYPLTNTSSITLKTINFHGLTKDNFENIRDKDLAGIKDRINLVQK